MFREGGVRAFRAPRTRDFGTVKFILGERGAPSSFLLIAAATYLDSAQSSTCMRHDHQVVSLPCAPSEIVTPFTKSRIDLSLSLCFFTHTHTHLRGKNASLQVAPRLVRQPHVVGCHSSGHDATRLRRAFAQYSGYGSCGRTLTSRGTVPSR